MKPLRVVIAILFCNKPEQTIECLESFKGNQIFILNNGSSPEATTMIQNYIHAKKNITYIWNLENVGVSKGRNDLITHIKLSTNADWIFFVDNDITIKTKNWKQYLENAIKENPNTLVFIPKLFNKHLNKLENLYTFSLATPKQINTYIVEKGKTNKISGGASIINKKLFDEIGLYDEQMFVGFEDFELSIRAIKMKKEIEALELPGIELIHDHRQVQNDFDNDYLRTRYNAELLRKSYGRIKSLYGLTLPDDGVSWAQNKINLMSKPEEIEQNNNIKVAIHTINLVAIGGVETSIRNFCKRMSKYYDITLYYNAGDLSSLAEISQWAEVEQWSGQKIETDIFIYATSWGKQGERPDKEVKAKKYIQMLHGDFEWMQKDLHFDYKEMSNIDTRIAVGKNVKEKFLKITGKDSQVIYNLLDLDTKPERVLRLISVTRLGHEKGLERMLILARKLKEVNKKFIWHIYGSGSDIAYVKKIKDSFADIPEVIFAGVLKDQTKSYVADVDYLVALSKSEGFSYSIYEALQVGTPCIVTDFPSAFEQIEDGISGYILKMDMSNLDIEKIYSKIPNKFKFKEFSNEQDWIKVLGGDGKPIPKKKKKEIKPLTMKRVKSRINYRDIQLNKKVGIGEIITVTEVRAQELLKRRIVVEI